MNDSTRPKVLVIGADRYALESCVRNDIDAVVIVGAKLWDSGLIEVPPPLRALPVDDHVNPSDILAALCRAGLADATWHAVHSCDEYALVAASLLGRYFGCPAIDPMTAVRFRDKAVQKAAVHAAGLNAARTTVIEDIFDVSGIEELPYQRAVLKPVAGAATSLTTVVNDVAELRASSREYAVKRIPQRVFVLEEFVRGDEWMVDGVVFDGEVLFCAVAAYRTPCLTTVTDALPLSTHRLDPDTDKSAYDKAVPFAKAALAALELRSGVFHLELFHDPDSGRITFGECAARRGGALVHEEIQAKFNVHLGECALMCSMGRRPEFNAKHRQDAMGAGYLLGKPGVLIRCPGPDDLLELPGVEFARIEQPYGTPFHDDVTSTNQRLGQVLIVADTHQEVTDRLTEVRTWFADRVVTVPDGARARELRAWQRRTAPQADFGDRLWHQELSSP